MGTSTSTSLGIVLLALSISILSITCFVKTISPQAYQFLSSMIIVSCGATVLLTSANYLQGIDM